MIVKRGFSDRYKKDYKWNSIAATRGMKYPPELTGLKYAVA